MFIVCACPSLACDARWMMVINRPTQSVLQHLCRDYRLLRTLNLRHATVINEWLGQLLATSSRPAAMAARFVGGGGGLRHLGQQGRAARGGKGKQARGSHLFRPSTSTVGAASSAEDPALGTLLAAVYVSGCLDHPSVGRSVRP